jgi:hypothetical protein
MPQNYKPQNTVRALEQNITKPVTTNEELRVKFAVKERV